MSSRVRYLCVVLVPVVLAAAACMEDPGNGVTKPGNQAPTLTAKVATTEQDTPVTIDLWGESVGATAWDQATQTRRA